MAERVIADETVRLKGLSEELGDMIQEWRETGDHIPGRVRPRLINMSNCQNITLSHVTLKKWSQLECTYDLFRSYCDRSLHFLLREYMEWGRLGSGLVHGLYSLWLYVSTQEMILWR